MEKGNKRDMALKISAKTGFDTEDCKKMLDAFEEILSEELKNSKGLGGAFDKVYGIMSFLKDKNSNR